MAGILVEATSAGSAEQGGEQQDGDESKNCIA
jgi:hypothetical protein